jgi:hypothetical protein
VEGRTQGVRLSDSLPSTHYKGTPPLSVLMASTSRLPARPALDASTWSSLPSSARATPDSDDSEDEAAWDEVDVAVDQRASVLAAAAKAARGDGMVGEEGGISIVLGRQEKGKGTK